LKEYDQCGSDPQNYSCFEHDQSASSINQILALSITATILMIMALFFPFLTLKVGGGTNQASIFDAVVAFSGAPMFPLALAVAGLIIILPTLRMVLLISVLGPLAFAVACGSMVIAQDRCIYLIMVVTGSP